MPNLLDQFYSNVYQTGLVRPNRFEVQITPPTRGGYSSLNSSALLRHMTFVCEAVEIPSQNISTVESKINGLPVIPVPNFFSYTNTLNLTFKLSQDYRERNMLLLWQDLVYKPGRGFSYYNDYIGSIIVKPMDVQNKTYQEFIFRNCFPVTVQDLQYSWASNNEYMKQNVTFSFFSVEVQTTTVRSSTSGEPQNNIQQLNNPSSLFSGFPEFNNFLA